ncbi:MAG TPA: hypothetical protein VJP78_01575 [Thermoleophilia bacterium]|nr:hypothetical protein [Thermoleophilia bacterium]
MEVLPTLGGSLADKPQRTEPGRHFAGDNSIDEEEELTTSHVIEEHRHARRDDPTSPWGLAFRILERWGFPAVVAAVISWAFWTHLQENRAFAERAHASFERVMQENTSALKQMSAGLERHLKDDDERERRERRERERRP